MRIIGIQQSRRGYESHSEIKMELMDTMAEDGYGTLYDKDFYKRNANRPQFCSAWNVRQCRNQIFRRKRKPMEKYRGYL